MKAQSTLVMLCLAANMACATDNQSQADETGSPTSYSLENSQKDSIVNRVLIRIGSHTFSATLANNPTVAAFKKQLPLTLSMQELNGNEKFAQLPGNLPTHAANPDTIQTGDLLLYGTNTLVIFYEPFRTSYTYTTIGRVDNPAGLAAALGTGNVTVTFELN